MRKAISYWAIRAWVSGSAIDSYSLWFYLVCLAWDWRAFLALVPFYYFGHCLSYLNGYYLHFGGKPDVPLAWGVSSYEKIYNRLWFNNGYHAEHHYRPRVHWTEMKPLHAQLADQQRVAGTRVIRLPHALAFLESASAQPAHAAARSAHPL